MISIPLLEVDVLLALAWPTHIHHEAAHVWFSEYCLAGSVPILFGDLLPALHQNTSRPEHRFWPLEFGVNAMRTEIREGITGHHQLADAMLLELAIRQGGSLATFDRGILGLLPKGSPFADSVAVISA